MTNTIILKHKKQIDSALHKIIAEIITEDSTIKEVLDYNLFPGGKRLRALLTITIYKALKGQKGNISYCACAPELLHIATLMLDDLPSMDNSDYRRNKISSHKKFDEASTILGAFGLATKAFKILSDKNNLQGISPQQVLNMINMISIKIGFNGLIGGQIADLTWGKNLKNYSTDKERLDYITTRKTADLFFICGLVATTLAEVSEVEQKDFLDYASNIGFALQIFDDLQDIHEDKVLSFPNVYGLETSKNLLQERIDYACSFLKSTNRYTLLLKEFPKLLKPRK